MSIEGDHVPGTAAPESEPPVAPEPEPEPPVEPESEQPANAGSEPAAAPGSEQPANAGPESPVAPEPEPEVEPESEAPPELGPEPAAAPTSTPEIGAVAPAGAPAPPPPPPRPGDKGPAHGAVSVGRIVEVSVVAVHPKEVEVRLIDGRIGVIPRSEFDGRIELGEPVEAALLARDDPKGRVTLSSRSPHRQRAWERVEAARTEHTPLTGPVTKAVKGGVVVDLGLRAFLPASLFPEGAGPEAAKDLVGTEVEVLVVEADRRGDRVVVSVRDLERRRRRTEEKDRLRSLEPGATVTGRVVSTADHGAVVDLGGVRGLVHRSELTWGRLGRVEDVVAVGEQVEVVVLDVQRSKRRVSLSLRATRPDPYAQMEVGSVHPATVTAVVDYGAFVRVEPDGAEGLVHISELSDVPGYRPDQLVVPGEVINVKVLGVDRDRHRLSLSVRQVLLGD